MLNRFRLAESPPHFNMAVWESSTVRNAVFFMIRSLTPPKAAGNALAFAVQPMGHAGALPGWGATSTKRINRIFLEETKRTRLAIVADLRRDHCIGGLILGGSTLPLTRHAGDAPGGSAPGHPRDSARSLVRGLPCRVACRDQPLVFMRTTGRPASARSPSVSPRTSWLFPGSWPASGSFPVLPPGGASVRVVRVINQ